MTPSTSTRARIIVTHAIAIGALLVPGAVMAQSQTAPSRVGGSVGVQGFGSAGLNWLAAKQSLEATGFERQQMEVGGGAQVTRLWRELFVRGGASRLSTEGERAFVNSAGESIPLGIPLTIKATYVDMTAGWTFAAPPRAGRRELLPYVGAGVGRVEYSERSPFAEPGDDFDATKTTYHALVGVHSALLPWLGVSVDARYRWIPKLLGEGGVSQAFEEKEFGGFDLALGFTVGFWGRRPAPPPPAAPPSDAKPRAPDLYKFPDRSQSSNSGLIAVSSPVFLRPDATLTPLRILEAGTAVRILEDAGEWIRIEFPDSQWGPRIGYVQRKSMQVPKK